MRQVGAGVVRRVGDQTAADGEPRVGPRSRSVPATPGFSRFGLRPPVRRASALACGSALPRRPAPYGALSAQFALAPQVSVRAPSGPGVPAPRFGAQLRPARFSARLRVHPAWASGFVSGACSGRSALAPQVNGWPRQRVVLRRRGSAFGLSRGAFSAPLALARHARARRFGVERLCPAFTSVAGGVGLSRSACPRIAFPAETRRGAPRRTLRPTTPHGCRGEAVFREPRIHWRRYGLAPRAVNRGARMAVDNPGDSLGKIRRAVVHKSKWLVEKLVNCSSLGGLTSAAKESWADRSIRGLGGPPDGGVEKFSAAARPRYGP